MKISELIAALHEELALHGDLPVVVKMTQHVDHEVQQVYYENYALEPETEAEARDFAKIAIE